MSSNNMPSSYGVTGSRVGQFIHENIMAMNEEEAKMQFLIMYPEFAGESVCVSQSSKYQEIEKLCLLLFPL